MKRCPVEAKLFHADNGRTDITMLTVAFRSFANAPKITKTKTGGPGTVSTQNYAHCIHQSRGLLIVSWPLSTKCRSLMVS